MPELRRWARNVIVGATGAAALALLYAWLVERAQIELVRYTVAVDKNGIPPEGITILHLSDFHFRSHGWTQSRKITKLRHLLTQEHYDLAIITGDLIHDGTGFSEALSLIEGLSPRLATFSCPGNHDYSEYSVWGVLDRTWRASNDRVSMHDLVDTIRRIGDFAHKVFHNELVRLPVAHNDVRAMHAQMEHQGITPLVNRAVHVQATGLDLWVAGVDDITEGQPDLETALTDVPAGAFLALISHNPDVWLNPDVERADLVLAGHTHGGQIRLPIVGAAHTQGTHLERKKAAGWFYRNSSRMFVSQGLGESIPLRFRVRPQATLIRIMQAAPKATE